MVVFGVVRHYGKRGNESGVGISKSVNTGKDLIQSKMKILIISERFYPQNGIGAVRPTKIAGKLFDKGYDVDAYTMYHVSREEIEQKKLCSNVYGMKSYSVCEQKVVMRKKHGAIYNALYRIYFNFINIVSAKKYCKAFARRLKEDTRLSQKEYDVVLSSFGPLSSLFCGLYFKKRYPNTKWICDFRDPVVVKYINPIFRPYYACLQEKACKKADAIVAVSQGYLERICRGRYTEKAHMIPNGYDTDELAEAENAAPLNEKLNITYVGSLYGGDRDMSVLFKAIKELILENAINSEKIAVNYAGKEFAVLKEQSEKYEMQNIVKDYGIMTREDCLKFQFSSNILLLSTWNDEEEYGVFPGKVLEYMLMKKPIVSITCGKKANGEVTRVIREGNFGCAYEEANDSQDYLRLKEYIKISYDSYFCRGKIEFAPKAEVLDRYNYENVIKQIEELMHG